MIDSHCHLHYEPYKDDLGEVINRAVANGVYRFILPGTDKDTHKDLIALSEKYPGVCIPTIGVHPTIINENENYKAELEEVERLLNERPVNFVAVGEIGLDYFWSQDYKEQQKEAFVLQLNLARKFKLPIIIHTRDAWGDTLDIMENFTDLKGVFHCFSGTDDDWARIEKMKNMYVGLNATISYKNYVSLDVLPKIPLERIILETDGPYLAPAPYRGKRNEPSYIPLFATKIAEIFSVSVEDLDKITTFNTEKLFNL